MGGHGNREPGNVWVCGADEFAGRRYSSLIHHELLSVFFQVNGHADCTAEGRAANSTGAAWYI